jgi:hypothetical protein
MLTARGRGFRFALVEVCGLRAVERTGGPVLGGRTNEERGVGKFVLSRSCDREQIRARGSRAPLGLTTNIRLRTHQLRVW